MKLLRYGSLGNEKPGIMLHGKIYDVSPFVQDYNEDFFSKDGLINLNKIAATGNLKEVAHGVRLGAPVARPSKIICIGLNYKNHALETGSDLPKEPVVFFKSTTALSGPNDDLIIPKGSTKTDWEVELAFVIGKKASYVEEADAMDYVAGYCLHNDYSERAFQLERGGQWTKGKGCDTFAPLGPYLVTKDEIPNPHVLPMWLTVNGHKHQSSNTDDMIFEIPYIISYVSHFMTLLPGDVISTGTPPGVGLGIKPEPIYLKPGDVVELGIEGLGSSKQHVKAYNDVHR